jgi:hypothetical protein
MKLQKIIEGSVEDSPKQKRPAVAGRCTFNAIDYQWAKSFS